MKITKALNSYNKLLKLKLIQNKIYTKTQHSKNIKLEDVEYRLKKILYVIYKYHIFNKRILFLGSSLSDNQQFKFLTKSTKHIFISNKHWLPGIFRNKQSVLKRTLQSRKNSEILTQLKKNINLIVILKKSTDSAVVSESYYAKIPIISINCNFDIQDTKSSYKVPGNFQFTNKKTLNNLFYSLLLSILKKEIKHSVKNFTALKPYTKQFSKKYVR